jgi:nicotinamidase-related amidase
VFYTAHDSRETHSPLKLTEPGGAFKAGLEPCDGEPVFKNDVNSGFIGTNLDISLRRAGVRRLVVVGFFTNMCIATTVRMAGNMGYDTYLVDNACACTNRVGPDGTDYGAGLIHADPEQWHYSGPLNLKTEGGPTCLTRPLLREE